MSDERVPLEPPAVLLPPVSDSPWFWVRLFALMGLAALLAIGPRYAQRQGEIELEFEGHNRAAYGHSVAAGTEEAPPAGGNLISLAPLIALVGVIAVVAHVALIRSRQPGNVRLRESS